MRAGPNVQKQELSNSRRLLFFLSLLPGGSLDSCPEPRHGQFSLGPFTPPVAFHPGHLYPLGWKAQTEYIAGLKEAAVQ